MQPNRPAYGYPVAPAQQQQQLHPQDGVQYQGYPQPVGVAPGAAYGQPTAGQYQQQTYPVQQTPMNGHYQTAPVASGIGMPQPSMAPTQQHSSNPAVPQPMQYVPVPTQQHPSNSAVPRPVQYAPVPIQQAQIPTTIPAAQPSIRPTHPATLATTVDQLAGQMQSLSTAPMPVGIIGQPLPLDGLRDTLPSPVQPTLDPEYMRITLNKIPKTGATLYKTKLPFGLTVTPYPTNHKDSQVPVIDGPIVRCRRCRTYLNPFVEMLDQGSKWKCNLCFLDNDCKHSNCLSIC